MARQPQVVLGCALKYAHLFAVPPAWIRAYSAKFNKSDAHEEAVSDLLLHNVGAFEAMVMDGAMELTRGLFCQKLKCAGVKIMQVEPHTRKSNHAEAAIRELKKAAVRRKMVRMKSPKSL